MQLNHIAFKTIIGMAVCILLFGCVESPVNEPAASESAVKSLSYKGEEMAKKASSETTGVFGQGTGGEEVEGAEATLRRAPNSISVTLSMPTPEPGTYIYPTAGAAFSEETGPPEVFSLWAFVFNNPEECAVPGECMPGDRFNEDVRGAAFAVAGHVVGGPYLTLSGSVSKNSDPFEPDDTYPLENPSGAEVLLAVAPHGALDSSLMPEALRTPTGPPIEIWWMARFTPGE